MENATNNNTLPEKIFEITSVSEYLEVLKSIKQIQRGETTLFYRGNANVGWFDTPSIYRNQNYINKEKEMYYEIISRCPDDFKHCKSTLDHLVMMQHYQLPTRLLDITENPLVALFFACQSALETIDKNGTPLLREANGKVNIYQINNFEIKNYNSDTAAMLANISKLNYNFDIYIQKINKTMDILMEADDQNNYEELPAHIFNKIPVGRISFFDECKELLVKEVRTNDSTDIIGDQNYAAFRKKQFEEKNDLFKELIDKLDKTINHFRHGKTTDIIALTKELVHVLKYKTDFFRSYSEGQKEILIRLTHFIKDEKPYFDPERMVITDFEKVICVKTKQDNPHIIKQQGSFFLFGVKENSDTKFECANIPDEKYFTINDQRVVCTIPNGAKGEILKELDSLSISESYLFPEIEYVAKDLKKRYEKPFH